ncbi:MAG: hypothetical protein IPK15_05935 [Verrucomicrobia bacterium]|nr:hypothetical protein [Verrucomicrobiota bacterium]
MNSRSVNLLLVATNIGLLGVLAWLMLRPQTKPSTVPVETETAVVTNTVTQIAVRKINSTNNLFASLAGRPLSWRALESTNYFVFIDNLRAFSCPEETIRDIIITDVAKLYGRRRSELRMQYPPPKFWEPFDPLGGSAEPVELQQKIRALDREQRQLIRDLLGVDLRWELAKYSGEAESLERNYSFLSTDKQAQVRAWSEHFDELEQDLYVRSRGWMLDEDLATLRQLQRQRREQLASMLNPEELEEYELRFSDTANSMRSQMTGFRPNEDEFRRIFRLQRTFDEQYDQAYDADDNAQAARARSQELAQDKLSAEIQQVLGPQRFAEYQRAQDGDYRALLQLGARLQMPEDVANRVYNMKQAAERVKYQVESNPNLTDDQRLQSVAALARETARSVRITMGDDVYKTYQQHGGQWLGNLQMVDESVVPARPQTGTTVPYDINQLPADLREYILNPSLFIRPEFRPPN